jgi:hypothetical protein
MGKPTFMVLTLILLWLIVLVPMIFRSVDERAQERSVRRFGRSMRLLNRRHVLASGGGAEFGSGRGREFAEASYVGPRITVARDELFVTGARGGVRAPVDTDVEMAVRRPEYVPQEAQMRFTERSEMSAARRQMMARRRRSLTILSVGSVVSLLLAFTVGGTLVAAAATLFSLGLGGYVYFLRTQALHDRERREHREHREHRVAEHRPVTHDLSTAPEYFPEPADTMVRIDDDSVDLHNLDTIDLTGLYTEQGFVPAAERRAS